MEVPPGKLTSRTYTDEQFPQTPASALCREASAARTHDASMNTPANALPWPPDKTHESDEKDPI